MSEDVSQPEVSASKPQGQQRSAVERIVVWGGILLLGAVVLIEYRAKTAFDQGMEWLGDHEYSKPNLDEVRASLTGATESETEVNGENEASFRWFSLFKNYEVIVDLRDAEGGRVLAGYFTREDLAQSEAEFQKALEVLDVRSDDPAPELRGMGGPGPPASHDAAARQRPAQEEDESDAAKDEATAPDEATAADEDGDGDEPPKDPS